MPLLYVMLEITTHPQDRLVPVDSSVSLTCTSSVSSDVTFSWTIDGRDVTRQSISTGDTSILTITSVRSSDDGSYMCSVRSGSLLVMSNTATLTVYGMCKLFGIMHSLVYLPMCVCTNAISG